MVKWISHVSSEHGFGVRVPTRPPFNYEINKKIIATAMGGYNGHRGYIYYLAVLPEFQKKCVGSKILSVVEKKLLKIGCPKINLFVRNTNVQVKSFYKKNQYTFQESEIYGKRLMLDN